MHAIRGAVGADDNTVSVRRARLIELAATNPQGLKMLLDHRVVNELAEKGDRLTPGGFMGGAQGVADAEAHAVMLSEMDFHEGGWC
jgi:hypothetical protein